MTVGNLEEPLNGLDPYLVWATTSDFRGFAVEDKLYQIAVEAPIAVDPPWQIPPGNPANPTRHILKDQRKICELSGPKTAVWTGTVDEAGLAELVTLRKRNDGIKLELNVPQNHTGSLAAAGTAFLRAKMPVLGKTVIAAIDHGCPFAHQQFLKKNNGGEWESRVRSVWDQDTDRTPPLDQIQNHWNALVSPACDARPSFPYGREITTFEMNIAIRNATNNAGYIDEDAVYLETDYPAMDARKTHGAHVLDVACGKVNPLTGQQDAASDADIIFVQLPPKSVADTSGGSMTKYVLDALHYIFAYAADATHLVINLSYGSTAGPHNGSSMLERAIDQLLRDERKREPGRQVEMVLPAGNHFLANGHTRCQLDKKSPKHEIRWHIMPDDFTDSFLELWYIPPASGRISVSVTGPGGSGGNGTLAGAFNPIKGGTNHVGAIVHATGTPNGDKAMVLIALAPSHPDAWPGKKAPQDGWVGTPHGIWTIKLEWQVANGSNETIDIDAWVERDDPLRGQAGQPQSYLPPSRFDRGPDNDDQPMDSVKRESTGNSLANGIEPIVVGACVNSTGALSSYSAAGPTRNSARNTARRWPDCLAVGDESDPLPGVLAAGTRSGILVRMNGTSVAAPQVARKLIEFWAAGTCSAPCRGTPLPPHSTATLAQQRGEGTLALRYP